MEIMENKVHDLIQFGRDNADAALQIHTENKMIHHEAAQVSTQHTDHNDFLIIHQCRTKSNQHTGHRHCLAQFHPQELIHHLCHDIQAAGRGIAAEQNRQTDTHHKDITQYIQERVFRNGLLIGEDMLIDTQKHRHQNGTVNCLYTKLRTNQQESQNQKPHIQDECNSGHRKRDEVTDDHSQSCTTAHRHMAGKHEEEYRCGDNQSAYGNDKKFFDIAFIEHGNDLFFYANPSKTVSAVREIATPVCAQVRNDSWQIECEKSIALW